MVGKFFKIALIKQYRGSFEATLTPCRFQTESIFMNYHSSYLRIILYLFIVCTSFDIVDAANPPNILILLGDDIDRTSLGPWGGQAHTPHIDQLARDGVRLDCVYANVAMCAPCLLYTSPSPRDPH